MTGNSLDRLVITSGQIKLDRRVFPEPVGFVVARLVVLHLLFDGAHCVTAHPPHNQTNQMCQTLSQVRLPAGSEILTADRRYVLPRWVLKTY